MRFLKLVAILAAQTWHRARFAGTELACRLAMNGYQDLLHNDQPR